MRRFGKKALLSYNDVPSPHPAQNSAWHNENISIGLFKEKIIQLMTEEDDGLKEEMFRRLIADMEGNIVPVRESKSAPRRWKYFNKYKCNQKPSF